MPLWRWNGSEFEMRSYRNHYLGYDALLVCPGPSLKSADPERLHVPGGFVVAVNTAWPRVRPDVWVGMDRPECYDGGLLWQPFMKIMGTKYREVEFLGVPLKLAPAVHFASAPKQPFEDHPARMFDSLRLVSHPDFCWVGMTFFTALHVAYWMGARTVYLVGADFGGPADYHDGRVLDDHLRAMNTYLMDVQVKLLPEVRRAAEAAGRRLVSCTPGGAANGILEYLPLDEALARIRTGVPDTRGHVRVHAYLAEHSAWSDEIAAPRGIVTGADRITEWMLPWWFSNLRFHNPSIPLAIADFGLSEAGRKWAAARAEMIDCTATRLIGWHNKPVAIVRSPFENILWLDTDCEIRADLAPMFDWHSAIHGRFAAAPDGLDLSDGPSCGPINTGAILCRHGEPLVSRWARAILAEPARWRGDQEALNGLGLGSAIAWMPEHYNWLRLKGPAPEEALIIHWTGVDGKLAIAPRARRMIGHRSDAVIERVTALMDGRPIRGAEIGIFCGITSARLLAGLPNLHLLMVDRWEPAAPGSEYAASDPFMARQTPEDCEGYRRQALERIGPYADRCAIVRAESTAAARTVADGSLDFAFIDGDHSFSGVLADLEAWRPKVRPGGILCGHDWLVPDFPEFAVAEAVRHFLGDEARIELDVDFTWFYRTPALPDGRPAAVGAADLKSEISHLKSVEAPAAQ